VARESKNNPAKWRARIRAAFVEEEEGHIEVLLKAE